MFDSAGKSYLLIVHTNETLRGVREIAEVQGAPAAFFEALDSGRSLPYFWQTSGYFPTGGIAWESYMHPATQFTGQRPYVYAVIPNPPGFDLGHVLSYDRYLEWLDRDIQKTWSSLT